MTDTIERFVQQAMITNNWKEVIARAENAVLQCVQIESMLFEQIPSEHIQTSPLLQKARCEELIRRGELLTARDGLAIAVKGLAAQTLRKPFLAALSQLAVVNLRMGFVHEARPIIRFLRDEWDGADQEIGGDVAYALARGLYLLEDEQGHSDLYYRYAIDAYDRDGETERGSLTLFELVARTHGELSSSDWEERMTEFAQRMRRRQIDGNLLRYLHALRLLFEDKLEQAEQELEGCGEMFLPSPYESMAILLQLRVAIRTRNKELTEHAMAFMENLHPESSIDLEWQFEWAKARFEWALFCSDTASAAMFGSQARAILKLGLPPKNGVWLEGVDRVLDGHRVVKQEMVWDKEAEGQWRVNLFGPFKFIREGQTIQSIHWKRKKTRELAIYLLLQQGYSAPKEQVAEALYSNLDPDKMANQLYVASHQLKSVIREYLGIDGGVVIKDGTIYLNAGLISEVDVEQYRALVRVGDQLWVQERELASQMYEKAAHLYDEIAIDVQYVDWLELVREQLRTKQCDILRKLGRYAVDKGHNDRAEACYKQWIALSPLNEEAYQELMRFLRNQGKQSELEFLYRQLEQLLHSELGIVPHHDTRSIIWR